MFCGHVGGAFDAAAVVDEIGSDVVAASGTIAGAVAVRVVKVVNVVVGVLGNRLYKSRRRRSVGFACTGHEAPSLLG